MDSDSQGPSEGESASQLPVPLGWMDIGLLQEDLSFCITEIFFMGFLSFAVQSHNFDEHATSPWF